MFSHILSSLHHGEPVVLATIISSSGSTPLPAGAMMITTPDGRRIAGTVGGGALESDVLAAAASLAASGRLLESRLFELNGEDDREAMLCGGRTTVLLECIQPVALSVIRTLEAWRQEGSDTIFARMLAPNGLRLLTAAIKVSSGEIAIPEGEELPEALALSAPQRLNVFHQASCHSILQQSEQNTGTLFLQPIPAIQRAIVFGGGHVGRCIAGMAARAGFAVTVVEDRAEFAGTDRFPEATRIIHSSFESAFEEIAIPPSASIAIVTRAHAYDSQLLERALQTPARYIGMLGSKRKIIACYDTLRSHGIAVEELKRVHAPIGLDIGSTTAEEIAVSVVAEMILARQGGSKSIRSLREEMSFYFQ